jgi:hypothetical protein
MGSILLYNVTRKGRAECMVRRVIGKAMGMSFLMSVKIQEQKIARSQLYESGSAAMRAMHTIHGAK